MNFTDKPSSSEQLVYYALRYELAELQASDTLERWNLTAPETKAVEKWMVNRMEEVKNRLPK